ncbi:hypothetical protein PV417_32335 [Streptomyces sp. ME19-03-3]|nr:hypothetical protein [Streptomyces sp. ME19-03-3]
MEYELPPLTDEAADALILGRFPDLPRPVRSRLSSAVRRAPRSTQRTALRHFVNRRELIRTVVLSLLSRTADQAEAALATEPTPLGAVRRFLRQAVDEHFGALCPMLGDYSAADDQEIFRTRSRLEPRSRNSSSQPNTRAAAVGLLIPDWLYEHSVWFHAGCLGRSALRDLSGRAKEPVLLKAGHSHDVDNHVVRNAGHRR